MSPATEIHGDTSLPEGFGHPHASEEARAIAQAGMILRVQVGSGVHGTSISGQDDRDEMGICLEPPRFVTGLARVPRGIDAGNAEVEFEQYQRHTVWDKPGGLANRSGAGIADIAHARGLVCFDPQVERLLPDVDAPSASFIAQAAYAATEDHFSTQRSPRQRRGWLARLLGRE